MRKLYVDYIKAIGIILVILGHINFANSHLGIKEWIYAFHMPLFFFATGLVIRQRKLDAEFLQKKFKVLIIPYIIWGLIYSRLSLRNTAYIGYGSYETLSRAKTLTSLWFLPAMFFAVILTQLVFQICKKAYQRFVAMFILGIAGINIPFISIGYPLCIDVAVLAATFILFGFFIETILSNKSTVQIVIITVVGATTTLLYRINEVQQSTNVLLAKRYTGNHILFFLVAIGGCLMVYGFSRLIDNGQNKKIISFIGSNTLGIFAVHKPIIIICEKLFSYVKVPWYLTLPVSAVITLLVSCGIVLCINIYVPVLNGRK